MPTRHSSLSVRCAERLVVALCVGVMAAAGCSSPSAPSPATPPVTQPPVTTPPPSTPTIPALTIACPANVTATSESGNPVVVSYSAPNVTGGVAPVQVNCSRSSGSAFPLGPTSVECTATDARPVTASCSFTVTVNLPPVRLSRTKFLAFGDSMTAGEIALAATDALNDRDRSRTFVVMPSAAYPTKLGSLLRARYVSQATTIDVANSGLPGEWAADAVRRLPAILANSRPEAVLLLHGSNDLAALGQPGVARTSQAIDTMAKEVRNRGARLFLATLPPPRPGGVRSVPTPVITSFNAVIRTIAAGENAVLVDVYPLLLPDVTRFVGTDGTHLTELGYERLAEIFFESIRKDLEVR
jgi:lysophospholipase L1-like esterase